MKEYKLYLIDLDGTIYSGNESIEYAEEFINYLNSKGIDYLFITNNSTKDVGEALKKLSDLKIKADEKNIFTSAQATALYLKKEKISKVYLIGENGIRNSLIKEKIEIVDQEKCEAVVVGLDRELTYSKLRDASSAILRGAKLIGTNPDKFVPLEHGFEPGNGGQVKYLEYATDEEAVIVGKPNKLIMELAINKFDYLKEDIVMVGDNYDTDIMSGINIGIDTIHVQTGVSSKEDVMKKDKVPTYTIKNLKELIL